MTTKPRAHVLKDTILEAIEAGYKITFEAAPWISNRGTETQVTLTNGKQGGLHRGAQDVIHGTGTIEFSHTVSELKQRLDRYIEERPL